MSQIASILAVLNGLFNFSFPTFCVRSMYAVLWPGRVSVARQLPDFPVKSNENITEAALFGQMIMFPECASPFIGMSECDSRSRRRCGQCGQARDSARQFEERVDRIVDILSQMTRVDGIAQGFKLLRMLGQDRRGSTQALRRSDWLVVFAPYANRLTRFLDDVLLSLMHHWLEKVVEDPHLVVTHMECDCM